MRLFIGITLSEPVNRAIGNVISAMKPLADANKLKASWVPVDNLHLTLKFLGSSEPALVERIQSAIKEACSSIASFDLEAQGTGSFPPRGAPRVLWVGINDPSGRLHALAAALKDELEKLGFAREKRAYSAHLTIARVKFGNNVAPVLDRFRDERFGMSRIDRVTLYESQTKPTGSEYRVVFDQPLKLS